MDRESSTSRERAEESEASSSHICRSVDKSSRDMVTEEEEEADEEVKGEANGEAAMDTEVKVKVKVKGEASMEWEGEVKGDVIAMAGPFP